MTSRAAPDDTPRSKKGERTRAQILEAALGLLDEKGYEGTTMRGIADRAGVSLGNAYHYFPSKEALLQGFYARTHEEHLAACGDLLDRERDLSRRLLGVMDAKLRSIEPYHRAAGAMLSTAADPASPLNPFSPESEPVRRESVALFGRVVSGSSARIHADLRPRLPALLWVWHMGVVLFWIHDRSRGRARTRALVEKSVALILRLVSLASNPFLGPLRRMALDLLDDVMPEERPAGGR